MIKYLALLLIGGMVFIGCDPDSISVSPNTDLVESAEPNWIDLPKSITSLSKSFTTGGLILYDRGGEIVINESYETNNGLVSVYAKLYFPPGTINEDTFITMEVDDETGVISFEPSMQFNNPAQLFVRFSGVDLSGVNPENVDFAYLAEDGNYQSMNYNNLLVKIDKETLQLVQGDVPHFSRFGFTR